MLDSIMNAYSTSRSGVAVFVCCAALSFAMLWTGKTNGAPFAIQGPGVDPTDFRITAFATNVYFPLGMVQLSDGSLLVSITQGSSYWSGANGRLLRLTDTNNDGIADGAGTVLYSGLTSGLTSLRHCGNLFFVTGQGGSRPISILRAGATPDAPITLVGTINLVYPGGSWLHPHSALNVRPVPGQPESCHLFFQLGSDQNFSNTVRTVTLTNSQIAGAVGTLQGQSIYRITITDNLTNVVASQLTRIAKGVRNPAGFAFHPINGDFYFEDNGIDGLVDPNEPVSADELNFIPTTEVGNGNVPDFGFPTNYTAYRTGAVVGGGGIQPLVVFLPLNGSESEGPNDIAFAPLGFPPGLNNGIFVGFHGKWSLAGLANEENPLVFVDLNTTNYWHFISNSETNIGHLDGLLSTGDSLFLADITRTGNTDNGSNSGMIYQIKSLKTFLSFTFSNNVLQLTWPAGVLQEADDLSGPWNDLTNATSPYQISSGLVNSNRFYRTKN